MDIEFGNKLPFPGKSIFENITVGFKKGRAAVIGNQRLQVLFLPAGRMVDRDLVDFIRKMIAHRHCQPLPALSGFNSVSILPLAFFILDIIQIAEHICPIHLIKIPEPGQILGLVNGNDQ